MLISGERRISWTGASLSGLHRDGQAIKLEISAELLNILNHPQFDLPAATIGQAGVGTITDVIGTPRDIQVGLRLKF